MNKDIKQLRNLFTYRMQMIKVTVKKLESAKLYAILLVSVMLAGIFSLYPVIPSLMNDVTASLMDIVHPWNTTARINCTGRIATPTTAPLAHKSELRGVFIHEAIFAYAHDWDIIAETLATYKIDCVYGNFIGVAGYLRPHDEWVNAINAFHSKGIRFNVVMNIMGDMASGEQYKIVDSNGNSVNWNCPIKIKQLVKDTVEEVAMTYDIDGFTFDYTRYPLPNVCYCPDCKAAFEEWLGEPIPDWPGEFAPGGSRYNEFMEWRLVPVTELVRNIRTWMLAINPNLEFRVAAWTLFGTPPTYAPTHWRYWIGQDTADWVNKGYVDICGAMMYTTQLTGYPESIEAYFEADSKYFTGGPEGKVPLVASITTGVGSAVDPNAFKAVVDKLRELGADGWIIWRYGGPGCGLTPDIRDYLSLIDLVDTFTLTDIEVYPSGEEATITWTTNLPTTSKVEYSTSPLFNASFEYSGDFHYWDVDHVLGIIVEDHTLVTNHSITLTDLSPGTKYYFRVQSEDGSGIATSKVLTFTTG